LRIPEGRELLPLFVFVARKSETDDFPLTMLRFAEFVYISAHPLLFTCNGLGVVGISAYCDHILVEERLTVVLFREVDISRFGRSIDTNLVTALKLSELFDASNDLLMQMKLVMAIRFGGYVTIWMAVVAAGTAYLWLMPS
jgi:hypothetical protein